jgi:hypothetical protein
LKRIGTKRAKLGSQATQAEGLFVPDLLAKDGRFSIMVLGYRHGRGLTDAWWRHEIYTKQAVYTECFLVLARELYLRLRTGHVRSVPNSTASVPVQTAEAAQMPIPSCARPRRPAI